MMTDWHAKPFDQVLQELKSNINGLTKDEAELRLQKFGLNKLAEEERTPVIKTVLHQFADPLIYILLVAAAISILLQDLIDAGVIFAVVILNAVIGFVQEFKAEEAIRSLKKLLALKSIVVRDGVEQEIEADLIVPGDIVVLQSGQKVPADLRLIQVKELQVDESAFTGESSPVRKKTEPITSKNIQPFEQKNMALMGTIVAAGRARAIVVSTGTSTQLGQISEEVRSVGPIKTPLQGRMAKLSRFIILAIGVFGIFGFIIGGLAYRQDLVQLMLTMIAMAVAAIPEGLPVALTIALAVAVNRMAKQKAIIRYLPAIETLGSSTVIGSDKTGTLTRNEMTVQNIWAGGETFTVEGMGYEPAGRILTGSKPVEAKDDPLLRQTLQIGLLASESNLIKQDNRWKIHGDPTEGALIVSAYKGGIDEEKEKLDYPQIDILPFESEVRYMATLNERMGKKFLLVKGAPEKILGLSTEIAGVEGGLDEAKKLVLDKATGFAAKGLRILAMAYKEMPPQTKEVTHDLVNNLTFAGFQGMLDPPRPEAIAAIKDAKASGIRVFMITGDNEATALSIAQKMGIAKAGETAISGRDFESITQDELGGVVRKTSVFARVSPLHKLRIVNALKANGEIVAVTGDGVNDAAALKAAHIGVAMGLTGTDVAKEASDMVVLDDNFASIYNAIVQGRVAFDNIRKVTFFLLTTGLGVLISILAAIITGLPLIFLPAQILWMNLVTNGLQDVALAFEPKEAGVEVRPPRAPGAGVLNAVLLKRLAVAALAVGAGSFIVFIANNVAGVPLAESRTLALTTIVFAQFFHVLNARSEKTSVFRQNLFKNRFLFFSMIAAAIAQLTLLYVPAMRFLFRTTSLNVNELLIAFSLASFVLFIGELDKWRLRIKAQLT